MKKDKEFFNLCINGDEKVISLLKNNKEMKNIQDNKGNTIYTYLIAGTQHKLLLNLLEKKLLNYSHFRKEFNSLMCNSYVNDKYIDFLKILNDKDRNKFLEGNINIVIEGNNINTIKLLNSLDNIKNINFSSLVKCNDEMLDFLYENIKNKKFTIQEIKEGFSQIKENKVRTSNLMDLISWQSTPSLYEDLSKINNYCISFLENKDLYQKLEKNLEERKKTNKIKI